MRRNAGVTLLEVLIASTLLAAVCAMAMSALFSTSRTAADGSRISDLELRGVRLLGACKDEFPTARFTGQIAIGSAWNLGIPPGGKLTFNTAVGFTKAGPADNAGAPTFGYQSPLLPPNNVFSTDLACFIRFEADTVYKESDLAPDATQAANWGTPFPNYEPLVPTVLNLDINRDGDRSDTFVRGRIVKYIAARAGSVQATAHTGLVSTKAGTSSLLLSEETLSDHVVLRVASNAAGHFNGDMDTTANSGLLFGYADKTGAYNAALNTGNLADTTNGGAGLLITVWHGALDDSGKAFILRKNQALIRFRAPQ